MKISERFDIRFEETFIVFENKSDGICVEVLMTNPKEDLEGVKAFTERELSRMHIAFGTRSTSVQFYRNIIRDCMFLLEHIDEVINLIVKHNL